MPNAGSFVIWVFLIKMEWHVAYTFKGTQFCKFTTRSLQQRLSPLSECVTTSACVTRCSRCSGIKPQRLERVSPVGWSCCRRSASMLPGLASPATLRARRFHGAGCQEAGPVTDQPLCPLPWNCRLPCRFSSAFVLSLLSVLMPWLTSPSFLFVD